MENYFVPDAANTIKKDKATSEKVSRSKGKGRAIASKQFFPADLDVWL